MSRFYVTGRRPNGSAAEADLMLGMRKLASGSGIEPRVLTYSPEFVFYERYVSVMKNTLLPVGVTMIGKWRHRATEAFYVGFPLSK